MMIVHYHLLILFEYVLETSHLWHPLQSLFESVAESQACPVSMAQKSRRQRCQHPCPRDAVHVKFKMLVLIFPLYHALCSHVVLACFWSPCYAVAIPSFCGHVMFTVFYRGVALSL